MGKLRSKVRYVVHKYLIDELTDEEFKDSIQEVIDEFKGKMPDELLYQDIGLIIWEREKKSE